MLQILIFSIDYSIFRTKMILYIDYSRKCVRLSISESEFQGVPPLRSLAGTQNTTQGKEKK